MSPLLPRIERSYDSIPRIEGVRVEPVGAFELFVREGAGWPFYARPRLGVTEFSADDVAAVLARQRALGVPEAIEWVDDVAPSLLAIVDQVLPVSMNPLMVLDPARLPPVASGARLLDPSSPSFADDCAASFAVAGIGFGFAGTDTGPAGPADRDAALTPVAPDLLDVIARGLRSGRTAEAVLTDPSAGIVARGAYQSALGAAEIVGVATLPSARHRGHGAAVSALLAREALARANDVVFLSAASEAVARVYARIGFARIGTAVVAEAATTHS